MLVGCLFAAFSWVVDGYYYYCYYTNYFLVDLLVDTVDHRDTVLEVEDANHLDTVLEGKDIDHRDTVLEGKAVDFVVVIGDRQNIHLEFLADRNNCNFQVDVDFEDYHNVVADMIVMNSVEKWVDFVDVVDHYLDVVVDIVDHSVEWQIVEH
jgi:hypothetical protein